MTADVAIASGEVPALLAPEQARGLEAGWRAVVIVVSAAMGISWFVGAVQIDGAAMFRSLFECAGAAVSIDLVLHQLASRFGFKYALLVGHVQKIVWLGVMWHQLGGIYNPMLLVIFFLPLLSTAILLMRLEALLTACAATAVVVSIALVEAPELRWYLGQLGLPFAAPLSVLSQSGVRHTVPFVGIEGGPEFYIVALLVFTSSMFGAAILSRSVSTRLLGLMERIRLAAASQHEPRELFRAALRDNPIPTALVFPDSGQIVDASRSFTNQMLLDRDTLSGKTLFDCLTFIDPHSVQTLLLLDVGELPFARYRIGNEARSARVRSHRIRFMDGAFAVVSVEDVNALSYLSQVGNAFGDPVLILRGDHDVVYFNEAARELCPGLYFGMDVKRLLDVPRSELWVPGDDEPGLATIRKRAFVMDALLVCQNDHTETLRVVRLRAIDETRIELQQQDAQAS